MENVYREGHFVIYDVDDCTAEYEQCLADNIDPIVEVLSKTGGIHSVIVSDEELGIFYTFPFVKFDTYETLNEWVKNLKIKT